MKFALVLLAVIGAAVARSTDQEQLRAVKQQQRIFEDIIIDAINSVIALLAPLDPSHVGEISASLLGHDLLLENINAGGISDVRITHVSLSGLLSWTFELELEVPQIYASVEHWKIDGSQVYGDGTASVAINNIALSAGAKVSIIGLDITDVSITPSIGNAEVVVTGVYNDPELSQAISEKATNFLNETLNDSQALHDQISEIIQGIIDALFG